MEKIAPVLINCNLSSGGGYFATTLTEEDQKDDNLGLDQDVLSNIDNGDTDVLKIEIVNGALQVSFALVETDEDKTTDDETFLKVSYWKRV